MQNLEKNPVQDRSDLVAYWSVPLLDGVHIVEFEHGTTTGKRVLRLDGKNIKVLLETTGTTYIISNGHKVNKKIILKDCKQYFNISLLVHRESTPLATFLGLQTFCSVLEVKFKELEEVFRKEWMFKLVGDTKFTLGQEKVKCELRVDPIPPFSFSYALWVDGKSIEKFAEKQQESMKSWSVVNNNKRFAVVLAKQTLEIWVNGQAMDVERDFVEDGTEMKFMIDQEDAVIRSASKQGRKEIIYKLYVNNRLVLDDSNNNT